MLRVQPVLDAMSDAEERVVERGDVTRRPQARHRSPQSGIHANAAARLEELAARQELHVGADPDPGDDERCPENLAARDLDREIRTVGVDARRDDALPMRSTIPFRSSSRRGAADRLRGEMSPHARLTRDERYPTPRVASAHATIAPSSRRRSRPPDPRPAPPSYAERVVQRAQRVNSGQIETPEPGARPASEPCDEATREYAIGSAPSARRRGRRIETRDPATDPELDPSRSNEPRGSPRPARRQVVRLQELLREHDPVGERYAFLR